MHAERTEPQKKFMSSDGIQRVSLGYDGDTGEITASGYYEECRAPLGLFLKANGITPDDCRKAIESGD